MSQITIIIHEGHGRPRHGRPGERPFGREGNQGPRHGRHGACEFGREEGHGAREFGRRHERGEGRRAFGERPPLSEAERRAARQLRHEVRRIMRAAEEAGLSPERVAHLVRRQTRHDFD